MSGLYMGPWPPPESLEHAGTGSADEAWPPPDPDDGPADAQDADNWPPREQSTETDWAAPAPKAKPAPKAEPKPLQSEPMKALQRVVDACSDKEALMMRRWGCTLMPARWKGKVPGESATPAEPGTSTRPLP